MVRIGQARAIGRVLRGVPAVGAQFAALPARAGDDDKPPAYKIYIDPETGKYTTRDPAAEESSQVTVQPPAAADGGGPDLPLLLTASGMIAALAALVLISKHRKQSESRH